MSYKTLLVHLDEDPRRRERLELGVQIASRFDAHLVGLYALQSARVPSYALAEAGAVVEEIETRRRSEMARAAETESREALRRAGVKGERLARHGIRRRARPVRRPAGALRSLRRALSRCRQAGAGRLEREPRAEAVEVVAFDPRKGQHGEVPGADLALFLARHGVKASAAHQSAPDVDVGSQLLSRAADTGADVIVMGGYGHSRLRELVLGGATRTLLEAMTVPVLMSH